MSNRSARGAGPFLGRFQAPWRAGRSRDALSRLLVGPLADRWVTSAEGKERLAACAMASNPDKIRKAPVTVVIGRDEDFAERMPQLFPHAPHMHQIMKLPAWGGARRPCATRPCRAPT